MINLKIYSNQSNKVVFQKTITKEIFDNYQINTSSDDFTEVFETELLSDILEENNINSSEVYYEILYELK